MRSIATLPYPRRVYALRAYRGDDRERERGSVIIWILVLIVLFGSLSFVVAQGGRSGVGQLTKEQSRLAASEMLTFLNSVKNAVNTLMINGCDPLKIDFSNSVYLRLNGTVVDSAPPGTMDSCAIFKPQGGGLTPIIISEASDKTYITSSPTSAVNLAWAARYADAQTGTSANDLVYTASGIKQSVCLALMNMVKVGSTDYTTVPFSDYFHTAGFNSWTNTGTLTNKITLVPNTHIIAFKQSSSHSHCTAGIVLKAF